LQDDNVKIKAGQLSKEVITQILSDKQTKNQTVSFLSRLASDQRTLESIFKILNDGLKNEETKENFKNFMKTTFIGLYKNDEMKQQTTEFLQYLLRQEKTKQTAQYVLSSVLENDSFKKQTAEMMGNLTTDPYLKTQTYELLKWCCIQVLQDEYVQNQAKDFVQNVLKDKRVHVDAGDALWEAVKNSVTPSFLK
jgi:uncharacterized membrane-anchored protein YjiN (DUF445 family)